MEIFFSNNAFSSVIFASFLPMNILIINFFLFFLEFLIVNLLILQKSFSHILLLIWSLASLLDFVILFRDLKSFVLIGHLFDLIFFLLFDFFYFFLFFFFPINKISNMSFLGCFIDLGFECGFRLFFLDQLCLFLFHFLDFLFFLPQKIFFSFQKVCFIKMFLFLFNEVL